jgi:hypothetical protein
MDQAVANKTAKEKDRGLVVGPFGSVDALHDHLADLFPGRLRSAVQPRVMPRFAVEQKGAFRAIDDAKSNGANAATRMYETVTTPSFTFPAVVARAAVEAAEARGLPPWQMVLSLSDLWLRFGCVHGSPRHGH